MEKAPAVSGGGNVVLPGMGWVVQEMGEAACGVAPSTLRRKRRVDGVRLRATRSAVGEVLRGRDEGQLDRQQVLRVVALRAVDPVADLAALRRRRRGPVQQR